MLFFNCCRTWRLCLGISAHCASCDEQKQKKPLLPWQVSGILCFTESEARPKSLSHLSVPYSTSRNYQPTLFESFKSDSKWEWLSCLWHSGLWVGVWFWFFFSREFLYLGSRKKFPWKVVAFINFFFVQLNKKCSICCLQKCIDSWSSYHLPETSGRNQSRCNKPAVFSVRYRETLLDV